MLRQIDSDFENLFCFPGGSLAQTGVFVNFDLSLETWRQTAKTFSKRILQRGLSFGPKSLRQFQTEKWDGVRAIFPWTGFSVVLRVSYQKTATAWLTISNRNGKEDETPPDKHLKVKKNRPLFILN